LQFGYAFGRIRETNTKRDLLKHARIETGAIFEAVDAGVDFAELRGIVGEYAWHRFAQ